VKYCYSEGLHEAFFEENPIPLLYVRNRKMEYLRQNFLQSFNEINFEHDDEAGFARANKFFPEEDMESIMGRMKEPCQSILKKYENSTKRVLNLVATHAAIVKALGVLYGGEFQHGLCAYCGISGIEMEGKNWRLIFSEDESHIANAKL
jgi:broad specificity phosphatase PhoE